MKTFFATIGVITSFVTLITLAFIFASIIILSLQAAAFVAGWVITGALIYILYKKVKKLKESMSESSKQD